VNPFSSLPAHQARTVRVSLASELRPEEAVSWLRRDERPFALVGDWLDGLAVLGSEPLSVADAGSDPFSVLETGPGAEAGEALVGGGWVGWLGYRLGSRIERLPPGPPAPVPRPEFWLAFYDHVVLFDGERWWFEALWSAAREPVLLERLALWQARLGAQPPPKPPTVAPTPFELAGNGVAGHLSAVGDCTRRIAEGELLQANLCVRLEARFGGDLLDLFPRALELAQPRFGALVDGTLSLSPERFLRRSGRRVQTEPIKGTRPRAGGETEQRAALDELAASSKDAAEHVMIVDLMRNDLGRVCEYGSIVAQPPRIEGHAGVWHSVSTVSGKLRKGVGDDALLRATFPPGSVTGAPKIQAMKVISALEATRRELYTGAIGIVSPIAGLDLSVAIRTFEQCGESIWLGVGGGIVADSEPKLELAEALAKAAGPIAAIGGELSEPRRRKPRVGRRFERATDFGERPDPAHGVFETVLVLEGRPVALPQHLERLAASLEQLYGASLQPGTAAQADSAAASLREARARLRIVAATDGSVTIAATAEPTEDHSPLQLTPFLLPGGLGAHKWRDRGLLQALTDRAPGTVPLLVDADGLVLEAGHANIWIAEHDALITPPADGRILPGTTRAVLLAEDPHAREEQIEFGRLPEADSIFLTSSIGGRRPARPAPSSYPSGRTNRS
jgi:para-aminobenzoate synthetase / 4-amino-4-deoxychorismate lyase